LPVATVVPQSGKRLPAALPGEPRLAADDFKGVIGHFVSGVAVITTTDAGNWLGTTASAVTSLTLEPPMLLVCLNRNSATGQAITRTRRLAVNVLAEDQAALAKRFATKAPDKFSAVAGVVGRLGQPLISNALAQLECEVTQGVEAGTHIVFFAEVLSATASRGFPLAYFRGEFGHLELPHSESVCEALRERILRRELGFDRPFDPSQVAAELDETPAIVTQALSKLARIGIVSRAHDGTYMVSASGPVRAPTGSQRQRMKKEHNGS
jgi:flavin reductase (DIM6/NTAB) family NADH-FMN oxidoreductase RutF